MENLQFKQRRIQLMRNLLFFGLLFSENGSLIDFYGLLSGYKVPIFTILYLFLTTLILLSTLVSEFNSPEHETSFIIQFFQNLGLLFSKTIIITLLNTESNLRIVGLALFMVQVLLVLVKVLYFGSVMPGQIAQSSNFPKLLRILKIALIAVLPMFVHSQALFVIAFALFQLSSAVLFCLKFTYQQSKMEEVVMIGVIGGIISTIEIIISFMAGTPHFFIGQFLMLTLFYFPAFSLRPLLEIKYIRLLSFSNLREDSQVKLIIFRFLSECLFSQGDSAGQFSSQAKGKCWLFFVELLKIKKGNLKEEETAKVEKSIWENILNDQSLLEQQFFDVLCRNIHEKTHFQSFAFKIECILKLKEKHRKYALIMYYEYHEGVKNYINILETCKLKRIYKQITRKIYEKKSDFAPANFINFDKLLQDLRQKIKECINFEIELIKYVSKEKKNVSVRSDDMLLKRNKLKEQVHNSILNLLKNNLYVDSNQFKYLFLLFHLSILKEPQLMLSLISTYFSCKEANQKLFDATFDYFIILDGSNNGQILNCNQNFKNKFKLNSQLIYNDKSTINKLFPTALQAKNHILKMNQSQSQTFLTEQVHSDFSCLIALEKEFQGVKFYALQPFTISTRIYYENNTGFNYICQFFPVNKTQKGRITLHLKQCQRLEKMIFNTFQKQNSRKVVQLQQQISVVDIYIQELNEEMTKYDEGRISQIVKGLQNDRDRGVKHLTYLQEKLDLIEKKIIQTKQESKCKWSKNRVVELCIFVVLVLGLALEFFSIQSRINLLQNVNSQKDIVKNVCLKRNKMMLTQLIMQIQGSNEYSLGVCNNYFEDFQQYLRNDISNDIKQGFDDMLNLILEPEGSDALFYEADYSQTYLQQFEGNISFFKYIHLLKTSFSSWISQNSTGTLDLDYYSTVFPKLLANYSFAGQNSPYPLIKSHVDELYQQLKEILLIVKPVSSIVCGLLIVVAITLRMMDTQEILDYLSILQNSPNGFLKQRQKELCYSRSLLQRLRYSYIYDIQIEDSNFNVRSSEKMLQSINDQRMFRKSVQPDTNKIKPIFGNCEEQQLGFLGNKNKVAYIDVNISSKVHNVVSYNKNYFIFAFSLLFLTVFSLPPCFDLYLQNIARIQSYNQVEAKLSQIQEKYINLVAYNWLKTTSVVTPFDLNNSNSLFEDTIYSLQTINYENTVISYYPRQIANEILYEDACQYVKKPQQCNKYRNGAFNSGSSVLLPLTINEQLQIQQLQPSFPQYLANACDKTFILYKIVIQFEKNLPLTTSQTIQPYVYAMKFSSLYFPLGLIIVLTLVFQSMISAREHIVLKQLLSLDYVENLYMISEFKPLFNKIFYK